MLRFRNDRWAAAVGLDGLERRGLDPPFRPLRAAARTISPEPLALRYHGHQFRVYNPDIGDGRGFLFAQLRDGARWDRLLDLGTKGSGQTPYSRFGDGRLTLKGGVREILATEMLEALGVETSKTFSLIETGEALERNDEPSPTRSAVLVRLQHSHIRIGTFQRLATLGEAGQYPQARRLLPAPLLWRRQRRSGAAARPCRRPRRRGSPPPTSPPASSTACSIPTISRSPRESFDYGPWRWTPFWDGHFTAAYFDHAGLYSFGRQPEAIHWDLVQLAISLRTIAEAEPLTAALETFPQLFQEALRDALFARLGIRPRDLAEDMKLVAAIEEALAKQTRHDRPLLLRLARRPPRAAGDPYDGFDDFRL